MLAEFTVITFIGIALLGLGAGVLGGLAGIGGSMLMLPGLHWLLGSEPSTRHHLYIAAALAVNVFVAYPAAYKHRRSGATRDDLLGVLRPATILVMAVGIIAGDFINGDALRWMLAGFLVVYCGFNLWRVACKHEEPQQEHARATTGRLLVCASITGAVGGVLGLAGGVLMVPLLQMVCGLGLRASIATSAAVVWANALIAACVKLGTIDTHGWTIGAALTLTALMAPTAMIGSQIGAGLTHTLPTSVTRVVITIVLLASAAKLAGLIG